MKTISAFIFFVVAPFFIDVPAVTGQTSIDIQGTWQVLSTTITNKKGDEIFKMDSSTHNLTKVITSDRVMFTIYNKKTGNLEVTGRGKATTTGNQYIETFEQSTSQALLREPMVFTYKIHGSKLSYEGGAKDFHIVEVLQRIEDKSQIVARDCDKVFTKVEKEARFPGGADGWRRYLEENLHSAVAADDRAPVGSYTVRVRFIVDIDGNISNVQAIQIPPACPSCGPEAVRVIEKGPRWEPAMRNGRPVVYQAVQLITFRVAR